MRSDEESAAWELSRVDAALRENAEDAIAIAEQFAAKHPDNVEGLIFLGRAYQARAQFGAMMETAGALALSPGYVLARLLMIDALFASGKSQEAFRDAKLLEADRKFDPVVLQHIAGFYTWTNRHADAALCYERVRVLQPTNSGAIYRLASAYTAMAEIDRAENLFSELLRKQPHDYSAYYTRAVLRKQTPEKNHVAEMERILSGELFSETAVPILCYSLAKELEDLGEWKRSFTYLKRGADERRRQEKYDAGADIAILDDIARRMDRAFFENNRTGYAERSPFFVIGMPRSGTTLVDRILSSHSGVGSVGESSEFSQAFTRRAAGGLDPLNLDYAAIGQEYCRAVDGHLPGYTHVLDKTPTNFYYAGAIAAALPRAKIVHLRRNPVDSCYAIYKTLFGQGCPYSYNLEELARYYLAYLRLMEHWRAVLPGRFLDVDYEELVADQEGVSRRIIAHCGLDWEDACLSFEKNASPSLTASAAQVRQPIYKSSVELWRRYENELAPLVRILRDAGIAIV